MGMFDNWSLNNFLDALTGSSGFSVAGPLTQGLDMTIKNANEKGGANIAQTGATNFTGSWNPGSNPFMGAYGSGLVQQKAENAMNNQMADNQAALGAADAARRKKEEEDAKAKENQYKGYDFLSALQTNEPGMFAKPKTGAAEWGAPKKEY